MISKRKENQLYASIYNDITDARIKVWKMKDQKNISIAEIDDILFDLGAKCPMNAIDVFNKK